MSPTSKPYVPPPDHRALLQRVRWGMAWGVTLSQSKPPLHMSTLVPVPSSFKAVTILMEQLLMSWAIGDFQDMSDSWLALHYQAKVDFLEEEGEI